MIIVVTGGAGAGKSTFIAHAAARLRADGCTVFAPPEAATITWQALDADGSTMKAHAPDMFAQVQRAILARQVHERRVATDLARVSGTRFVALLDRGELDADPYLGPAVTDAALATLGTDRAQVLATTTAVLHLVSPAVAAPERYETDSNAARWENPVEAARAEAGLRRAWETHPHHHVVDWDADMARRHATALAWLTALTP